MSASPPQETCLELARIVADAILAGSGDAVVAADRQGIIRIWNPGAERIFGYLADEAIGQSLDLIIPERLRARHWEGYRQVIETGESRFGCGDLLAVPGIRKGGQRLSLEFTIVPLKDDRGHMIGQAAVMRDVTRHFEEIKALKRRLADMAEFGPIATRTLPG